jgi:FtsP/CotA-like multicopper oxidase with cupredoxin domain
MTNAETDSQPLDSAAAPQAPEPAIPYLSFKTLLLLGGIGLALGLIGLALVSLNAPPAAPAGSSTGHSDGHGVAGGATGGTPVPGQLTGGDPSIEPVDVRNAPVFPVEKRGAQPLEPELVDGVKEFRLTASVIRWHILPNVEVGAYAYNEQVPGPLIRVTEGDRVRMVVKNDLPEPTTVHWHGLQIPNDQDGAGSMTQRPIQPGEVYTYSFTIPATPGTYWYHTHVLADKQQTLGLYGPLIIDARTPAEQYDVEYTILLGEWAVFNGQTIAAMPMAGMEPNYFTINGKSWPATDELKVKVGQRVLIRFIGSGQFIHPMHLHGQPFIIVATDGNPVPLSARLLKDTVLVGPGERYDVAFTARAPGMWMLHCHINHHLTNDHHEDQGAGGLTMTVNVMP